MISAWFSVEYFWCSVEMRTYCAARVRGPVSRFRAVGSLIPGHPIRAKRLGPARTLRACRAPQATAGGGEMSPTQKDRILQSDSGNSLPPPPGPGSFPEVIAEALR